MAHLRNGRFEPCMIVPDLVLKYFRQAGQR